VNVLPEDYAASLQIGDLLQNDAQNPLLYHRQLVAVRVEL
jgi:phytanoyl-CoA hydroxylase